MWRCHCGVVVAQYGQSSFFFFHVRAKGEVLYSQLSINTLQAEFANNGKNVYI